jgi:hypothetical protein
MWQRSAFELSSAQPAPATEAELPELIYSQKPPWVGQSEPVDLQVEQVNLVPRKLDFVCPSHSGHSYSLS